MDILIEQIKPGREVDGTFVLKSKKLLPLHSGAGHYLAVVLEDKTGQAEGRLWDPADETLNSCRAGDVVQVQGQAEEYNGKVQINISSLSVCRNVAADPAWFNR